MDVLGFGVRVVLKGAALGLALFAIGFIVFANAVGSDPDRTPTSDGAEAIVVFTGGTERVTEAVKLLSEGKATRLLITGVHPTTTAQELEQHVGAGAGMFACCIDLDRRAQNTMDNALETRTWAERNNFASLIVVTSSYHMPRALAELERNMPNVKLVPHAVVPGGFRFDAWWGDGRTARLLFVEYVKYLPALTLLGASRIARQLGTAATTRATVQPA